MAKKGWRSKVDVRKRKSIEVPEGLAMRDEHGIEAVTARCVIGHRRRRQLEYGMLVELADATGDANRSIQAVFRDANRDVERMARDAGISTTDMRQRIMDGAGTSHRQAALASYSASTVIDVLLAEINQEPVTPSTLTHLHEEVLDDRDAEWLKEALLDAVPRLLPEDEAARGNDSSGSTSR